MKQKLFNYSPKKEIDTVKSSVMFEDQDFILEINPADDPKEIFNWCENNRQFIESALLKYGGIAFRGFGLNPAEFRKITDIISLEPALSYTGGIAPRKNFGDGVYLSTTIEKRAFLI